jgi:hypothetical protein
MNTLAKMLCVAVVLSTWSGLAASLPAAEVARNDQAIREVQTGQRKEAHAAWWGFSAEESTAALQAAINSGVEKLIVDKMPSPWIVDKIQLASNQEIFFEPGVVVEAKKGAFHGKADALFSAWDKTNIKLIGPGATLRMQREDYDSAAYTHAEWRHVLNFHGCTKVTVLGLTLSDSGGDGIYLGTGRGNSTNRDVVIRDVVCDRNYRQGISVITAENLLIENCVLKNTKGTPPAAGIDFEPNLPRERLVNCVMRKCVMEDNQGYAFHLYARPLDGTSAPMSIRVEDCVTRGTNARSVSVITSCGKAGPVKGLVEFVNCRFEDAGKAAITVGSKPTTGAKVRFVNCTLADPSDKPTPASPIMFSTSKDDLESVGGVEFDHCTICERVDRPVMKYDDIVGARLRDITGTLIVERGGQRTVHTLTPLLLNQWIPFDPVLEIAPVDLQRVRLEPIAAAAPAARKLPGHRVRGEGTYLLYATSGDAVSVRVKYQALGRYEGKTMPVRVFNPAGKEVVRFSVPFKQEAEGKFTADQTGLFTLVCQPDHVTAQVSSSTHPVCLAGNSRGQLHLLGTTGDFYFYVPADAGQFGLRFKGEGEGERVSAAVFDATGKCVWEQPNIATSQSFRMERTSATQGEVWHFRLSRPTIGVLEDTHVEIRGLPPVLGFTADSVLRPVPGAK